MIDSTDSLILSLVIGVVTSLPESPSRSLIRISACLGSGFYGDSSSWMNSNDSVQYSHVLSEVFGFTDVCVCVLSSIPLPIVP